MNSKRSSLSINQLVTVAIIIIVFLVIIFVIPTRIGSGGAEASELLDSTEDSDGDGIVNYFDKCDCEEGERSNDGCPAYFETSGPEAQNRENECKKQLLNNDQE
jgi:hypothetical protein